MNDEINPSEKTLTPRFSGEYERFQFEKITGLLTPAEVKEVKKEINKIIKSKESFEYYENDILIRIENFIHLSAKLKEILLSEKIIRTVSLYLEEEAVLFKDKLNFKTKGSRADLPHQDIQANWGTYGTQDFVSLGLSLDTCDEENSCVWFLRRQLPTKSFRFSDTDEPLNLQDFNQSEFVPVEMNPGDASVHSSFAVHYSESQKSDRPRRIIYLTFNKKSFGDHRTTYYNDKLKTYPPNNKRKPGETYEYKV